MTNRRTVLKAVPALAALTTSAAAVSPLRSMYYEWQKTKSDYNANAEADFEPEDPEQEAIYERMIALEEEAAAFTPETLEDLAFQVIFADDDGDLDLSPKQRALAQTAYRIAGIKPGRWWHGKISA